MEHRAIDAAHSVLVYQSLKSIDATYRLVVGHVTVDVSRPVTLPAVTHLVAGASPLGGLYDVFHPILVPVIRGYLAPQLLRRIVNSQENVRGILRIHCPSWPVNLLVTSQRLHRWSIVNHRGDWYRSYAVSSQVPQYRACFLGADVVLRRKQLLQGLVVRLVQHHLGQLGKLRRNLLKINCLQYLLLLLLPVHVMHHDPLFEQMIEAALVLPRQILHLHLHHPLHEVLHDGGSRHVTALHGGGHQVRALHNAHQHADVTANHVIYHVARKIGGSLPRKRFASSTSTVLSIVATLAGPHLKALIEVFLTTIHELSQVTASLLIRLRQSIDVRFPLRIEFQRFLDVIHEYPSCSLISFSSLRVNHQIFIRSFFPLAELNVKVMRRS